jgi:hypothetical protein
MSDSYAALFREMNTDSRLKSIPKIALVDDESRAGLDHQFFLIEKGVDFAELKRELMRFLKA